MKSDNKIRVLVVFAAIANGGVEHILTDIFNNLDSNQFESEAVYHPGNCELSDVPLLQNTWKHMEQAPDFKTLNWLSYRKWWIDYIKRHKHFDIIHLNYLDSAFCFLDLFNSTGTISIGHAHNPKAKPYSMGRFISDIISYPARYMCKYLIACSKQAAQETFGKKEAQVLLNGIDLTKFKYNISQRNMIRKSYEASTKFIIGNVGRFVPQKNHDFIIKIFEEFHKTHSNAELWLIGDGELKNSIKNKLDAMNLSQSVRFIGIVNNVEDYMNAFDVFLFPSTYEGLGIVAVEAQATGLPCIVSDAVPDEADIKAGIFRKLSLKAPIEKWCAEIDNATIENNRTDQTLNTKMAGFDIKDKAIWVTDFYNRICMDRDSSLSE